MTIALIAGLAAAYLAALLVGIFKHSVRWLVVGIFLAAAELVVTLATGSDWWVGLLWVFNGAMCLSNIYFVRQKIAADRALYDLGDESDPFYERIPS